MSIVVTVRAVTGKVAEITVDPAITIADLQQRISDECGLGYASTLVYKGAPLKNTSVTLDSIGYKQGDSLIGVFKKEAPKPAPAPTPTPAPADTSSSTTPAAAAATPTPAAAKTEEPKEELKEWACVMCTYINIPARTICEMCESPNPNRPIRSSAATRSYGGGSGAGASSVPMDMSLLEGLDTDGMDEATLMAIQSAMTEDLYDDAYGDQPHDDLIVSVEDIIERARHNEDERRALCREFGIPEDSSVEDLHQAILSHDSEHGVDLQVEPSQLIDHLMSDPALVARIQESLPSDIGNNPDALREVLLQLLSSGQLSGMDGLFGGADLDEDEDDDDDGMGDHGW